MENSLFGESLFWRNARKKRVLLFTKILAYLMIVMATQWAIVTLIEKIYFIAALSIIIIVCGIIILSLIAQNKLSSAKFLVLFTCTSYYLTTTIFASGYGTNGGTAHFGFIIMSLVAFFLLADMRLIREVFSAVLLLLFFLFHFGIAPFHPMVFLKPGQETFIHRVDIIISLISIFFITRQFVIEISKSEEGLAVSADKLESIVGCMLPPSVAERIRNEGKTFADEIHDCSVLFADIAGFSSWSEKQTPNEIVSRLNDIFSRFDDAVERLQLTKIKTIGDSYMVASGIPEKRKDHAIVLVELGLELQKIAGDFSEFSFRIGISSGPLVAGIIGKKIFLYDIWGHTVNTAARMEAEGEVGKVNICKNTFNLIKNNFVCKHRGKIFAKNIGDIDMFFAESAL